MVHLSIRNRVTAGPIVSLRALSLPIIIPNTHCILGLCSSILLTPVLALLKLVSPWGFNTSKPEVCPPRLSVTVLVSFNVNLLDFMTCLRVCLAQLEKVCMMVVWEDLWQLGVPTLSSWVKQKLGRSAFLSRSLGYLVDLSQREAYAKDPTSCGQALSSAPSINLGHQWFMWLTSSKRVELTALYVNSLAVSVQCWMWLWAGLECTAQGLLIQCTWGASNGGPTRFYSVLSWREGNASFPCSHPKEWRGLNEIL